MIAIKSILLDVTAILTVVFGVAGLVLSLALIFFPDLTRAVDAFFSKNYDLNKRLAYFDQTIRNDLFVYRHPKLYGATLIAGAFIALIYFWFGLDIGRLIEVLQVAPQNRLIWEMVLRVASLTGQAAALAGIVIGAFLMLAPGRLQRMERTLNKWIATQHLIDRLDVFNHVVDVFSFRHPLLIGSIGAVLSALLLFLAITNFFKP
jgi:hypothetical protein